MTTTGQVQFEEFRLLVTFEQMLEYRGDAIVADAFRLFDLIVIGPSRFVFRNAQLIDPLAPLLKLSQRCRLYVPTCR